jgi:hypothetical protein
MYRTIEQDRFDLHLSSQQNEFNMENELQTTVTDLFAGYTVFEILGEDPILGDLDDDKCWTGSL